MAVITINATAAELNRLNRQYCTCGNTSIHEAAHAPDCTYRALMEKMTADVERELASHRCGRRYANAH